MGAESMTFLARSAEGLYWMRRYLERAEHLCRLLCQQIEVLVDRPTRQIDLGWNRIYLSLERQPGGAHLEATSLSEDFALAGAYTLADDLTFERGNPDSLWSCLDLGRENARQMRHCISEEMWLCLNQTWRQLQNMELTDIWRGLPHNFYLETAQAFRTFASVAEMTSYRDQRWHFMQLGLHVERTQLMLALMNAQLQVSRQAEDTDADWSGLLLRYHAFDAYQQRHGAEVVPAQVLDLLAGDAALPTSLHRSLDMLKTHIQALPAAADTDADTDLRQLSVRLFDRVHAEWPLREAPVQDREQTIHQAMRECRELHDLLARAYF